MTRIRKEESVSEVIDEYADPEPVDAQRTIRRALVLAALSCRGSIEAGAGQPEAESLRTRILDWIAFLNIDEELGSNEKRILQTHLGMLQQKDVIESTWVVEGLAILGWALNLIDLPKHDEKINPIVVTDSLCFLSEEAPDLFASARLRKKTELKAYREVAYAIHCRLKDYAKNKDRKEIVTRVEMAWIDLLRIDPDHFIVCGDLGIYDKEISDAEQERVQDCVWLTFERHRAIIWLLGGHPIYSETPVDT